MWHYFIWLLLQALRLTITHMGTTVLAVGAGLARNSFPLLVRYRSLPMTQEERRTWWKEIKPGVIITLGIWSLLFMYCVIDAAAFNDHKKLDTDRQQCVTQNNGLQGQLNELNAPNLSGSIDTMILTPVEKDASKVAITVGADIKNTGAPTTIFGETASLKLKDGKVFQGDYVLPPPVGHDVVFCNDINGGCRHNLTLEQHEHLRVQADSGRVIVRGAVLHGWIEFRFPVPIGDVDGAAFTLTYTDFTNKLYSIDHPVSTTPATHGSVSILQLNQPPLGWRFKKNQRKPK